MNFQAVEQANGNSVTMFGVFTEVGGVSYTQNQKAKSVCKITDDMGISHRVHIYQGKGQLPTPQQAGQRWQFNLSTFQGTSPGGSYTGYSGFWISSAQVNQPQQNAPQNIPQGGQWTPPKGRQATPQATGATKAKDVDWDAKDLRMARMNALTNSTKLICLIAEANKEYTDNITEDPTLLTLIRKSAEVFVQYIYNGLPKQNTVKQAADQAAQEIGNHYDESNMPTQSGDQVPDFLNE